MFIGHFGVGFAAKRAAPKMSLGTLMAGVLWADLLLPLFMLAGWERAEIGSVGYMPAHFNFPYSHSLAALAVWAILLGGIYFLIKKDHCGALVLGLCVLSHFLLDWMTHRTGVLLYPGGEPNGLGLWNLPWLNALIESAMLAAGLWIYVSITKPKDAVGVLALSFLIALLAASFASTFKGPMVHESRALGYSLLSGWLFPLWTFWIDRHRTLVPHPPET